MGGYWKSLTSRERNLVKLGAGIALLILFYLTVWEPKVQELREYRLKVPQLRATLAWMEQEIRQAQPRLGKSQGASGSTGPLLTVIEQAAQKTKLREAIQRMQPVEAGEVQVWFQDARADDWLRWLDALARQGVYVVSATVTRSATGMVSARVTVTR